MKRLALMSFFAFSIYSYEPWTWTYRFTNSSDDAQIGREIVVNKMHVPSFNQLICSWNCHMPTEGYFSFFVQVCNEKTGHWSDWIHMADWGNGIQKTYLHKSDALNYHYVRLELGSTKAYGFKIKVIGSQDCDSSCNSINVCVSDLNNMVADQADQLKMKSCYITKVPFLSQFHINHPKNDALCSPTSCTMLLRYYLGKDFDPAIVAEHLYDQGLGIYGSWPCNMAGVAALSEGKLNACVTRLDNFQLLHRYLTRGIPVCVSVRGPLAGSATPYASGHILIVKGFDAMTQEVICNDPAFENQSERGTRYSLTEFLKAWERSKRLAYIVIPQEKLNK